MQWCFSIINVIFINKILFNLYSDWICMYIIHKRTQILHLRRKKKKLHKMFFSPKMDDGILLPIIYAISFLLNKIVLAILYKNVKVLYVYIRKALQKQRRLWYNETCINRCLLECTISRNKNLLNEFELKRYTWHLLILPFGDVNTFDVYWYIY